MSTKTRRLKSMLTSKDAAVLMEAHNGLSAKLAQEAGFQALWGSGLSISAALGVRDNNEASWTQVLEVLEFMNDATDLPILMDGDTGYGNFNNMRRLVTKLEQRGIAGVAIEDKLFPKTNSFIDGEKQMLAEIDEFCGKIRAAKETQRDPDFVVVARTEAFIAGWGLREALIRATAYADSGADAILVHSKRKDPDDIVQFMKHWNNKVPVVIVPTKYPTVPLSTFQEVGVHNFIFANQSLRTVVTALQQNLKKLRETYSLMSVEKEIASVDEVFRLQNVQELKSSEKKYLPTTNSKKRKALVLGAAKGDFGAMVENKPKCMLPVGGKPVLTWQVEAFNRAGIKDVAVVRGYRKEAVDLAGLRTFDNDQWATTGELASLYAARDMLNDDVVISYGDVVFDDFILQNLVHQEKNAVTIAADASWKLRDRKDAKRDLVATQGVHSPIGDSQCNLVKMGSDVPEAEVTGEFIGLMYLSAEGARTVASALDHLAKNEPETLAKGNLDTLFRRLAAQGQKVSVVHTYGHWRDLDTQADLVES